MTRQSDTKRSSTNGKTWSFSICENCAPSFTALLTELEKLNLVKVHRHYPQQNPPWKPANGVESHCPAARPPKENYTATRSVRGRITPSAAVILVLLSPLLLGIGLWLPAQAEERTLAWLYDPVELQRGMTNENARVWFRLHYTQDPTIPLTNWIAFPATTNTTIKVDVPRTWGFFALNASNYLGLSWCLNLTNIPAPVLSNYVIQVVKP